MEIRQLESFKTVVELHSFTKAAQVLQYSQASITSHIHQLEHEIGIPLFDRIGKHFELTTAGRELYQYTIELLATYQKIKNISANESTIKGELRIGAAESLTVYRLGAVLSQYTSQYPDVAISLVNDHCPRLRERLTSGELDVVITLEPSICDPQFSTICLTEERLVFVGKGDHPADTLEDILDETMIFSDKGCSLRKFFERFLMDRGISVGNQLEFTSLEAMKQCVMSGLGISLLPYMSVETLIEDRKLKAFRTSHEDLNVYSQISYHKNKWLSPAHRKFIDMVVEVEAYRTANCGRL